MSGFLLLRPWWLLALLPLAGLLIWHRRRAASGGWEAVISPEMRDILADRGWYRPGAAGALPRLLPLALLLLTLGLAGPAVPQSGREAFRRLDPLLLLLDLSPSVVASPLALAELKTSALRFLKSAEGRPVGLMGWAADAYLISPPTSDALSLEGTIAVLSDQTMPVAGSRPDIALSLARDLFSPGEAAEGPGIGGADLVLLTDGAGLAERAVEEARRLRSEGARVWVVHLPVSAPGAPPPDAAAAAALARAGGGGSAPAEGAAELAARIATSAQVRLLRDPQSGAAARDFGPWLFAAGVLLLAGPLFRRREG